MSTMRMNPETGYPEIMPDSRIPPGGHTLGRIGGLPGLQPPPLDPRQQIQQIMAQGPTQPQRQSGREGYINSKLSVAFFNSPEAEQQAREQLGKDYDADPSIYQQQPMQTRWIPRAVSAVLNLNYNGPQNHGPSTEIRKFLSRRPRALA